MASLRSIMNSDEDHYHDPPVDIRETDSASPIPRQSRPLHPSSAAREHHSSRNTAGNHQRHHHSFLQHPQPHQPQHQYYQQGQHDPRFTTHPSGAGPFAPDHSAIAPGSFSPNPSSSPYSSNRRGVSATSYRGSSTPDPMDQQGYPHGHPHPSSIPSPSSRPSGSARHFNGGMAGEVPAPVKYTPVTGRVSKALKGMPVHMCNDCVPPRTFTRNEHLKRHQLSHKNPGFECKFPSCGRKFHRKDLLDRHEQKHEQDNERAFRSGSQQSSSRRSSNSASESGGLQPRFPQSPYSLGPNPGPAPGLYNGSPTTHNGGAFYRPSASPGNTEGANTASPRNVGRSDSYGRRPPQSQGFGNNYGFASPSSHHQMPMLQHQHQHAPLGRRGSGAVNHNDNHSLYGDQPRTPQRPTLQIQFLPPADNPPDLVHAHEASGVPSSASSTYSPASEFARNKPQIRSSSVDWVDQSGFLSPSPFAATSTPIDVMSPLSLDNVIPNPGGVVSSPPPSSGCMSYTTYSTPQILGGAMFAPQSQPVADLSMAGLYSDDHGLLDPHQQHQFDTLVRSPTLIPVGDAQSELLVTPAPAGPPPHHLMGALPRHKSAAASASTLLPAAVILPGSAALPRSVCAAVPVYVGVYWERVHAAYPVVHRRTFEESSAAEDQVLRCAMAAVATLYLPDKVARANGCLLHEYAMREAGCFAQWTLPIMQTIFLCEFFSRIKNRKVETGPYGQFESLCQRVSEYTSIFPTMPVTCSNDSKWRAWVESEGRRRLLAACFAMDVRTRLLYGAPTSAIRNFTTGGAALPVIPLSGTTASLWNAESADAWLGVVSQRDFLWGDILTEHLLDELTAEVVESYSDFDRAVVLAALAHRLNEPAGDTPSLPNTYAIGRIAELFPHDAVANLFVALHYIPVSELVAVASRGWPFANEDQHQEQEQQQQQQPPTQSQEDKLLHWTTSGTATMATGFSCRALAAFFNASASGSGCRGGDVLDYWGVYVCALVCWASGSGQSWRGARPSEDRAVAWVREMAASGPEVWEEKKGEAGFVVGLVRGRMEGCAAKGGEIFADAVRVLKALE